MMRDIASLNAGAVMADASLNRQQTIRVGAGVAFAHFSSVGFDGQIELEALRLFGLPEAAPAVLYACPSVPIGTRSLALETSWDLPSLAAGATANIDVTVAGARRGDFADASLDTSSIAFVLDCHVWLNHSVRVTARNVSASTVDLASAALSVRVVKRRPPWPIQKIGLLSHNNYFPPNSALNLRFEQLLQKCLPISVKILSQSTHVISQFFETQWSDLSPI